MPDRDRHPRRALADDSVVGGRVGPITFCIARSGAVTVAEIKARYEAPLMEIFP